MSGNSGGLYDLPGESEAIDLRIEDEQWIDEVLRQGERAAVEVIRQREDDEPAMVRPEAVVAPASTKSARPTIVDPDLAAIAERARSLANDAATRRRRRIIRQALRLAVVFVVAVIGVLIAIRILRIVG